MPPLITEADILARVVVPNRPDLGPDAARSILKLRFDRGATRDIRWLLQKNNNGTISAEERLTLEKYLRVGQMLDLLHTKARLSLHQHRAEP
jgi:hypothetical protein